jgi:predicted N-acetyltransferase YhbS
MSIHVPGERPVLIHGVCVSSDSRRRGIASALLAEYQRRLAAKGSHERALLIAHEEKAAFYERIGFKSRAMFARKTSSLPSSLARWQTSEMALSSVASAWMTVACAVVRTCDRMG